MDARAASAGLLSRERHSMESTTHSILPSRAIRAIGHHACGVLEVARHQATPKSLGIAFTADHRYAESFEELLQLFADRHSARQRFVVDAVVAAPLFVLLSVPHERVESSAIQSGVI